MVDRSSVRDSEGVGMRMLRVEGLISGTPPVLSRSLFSAIEKGAASLDLRLVAIG